MACSFSFSRPRRLLKGGPSIFWGSTQASIFYPRPGSRASRCWGKPPQAHAGADRPGEWRIEECGRGPYSVSFFFFLFLPKPPLPPLPPKPPNCCILNSSPIISFHCVFWLAVNTPVIFSIVNFWISWILSKAPPPLPLPKPPPKISFIS